MHRNFSVIAYGDTVWIGSSNGIGRTFDGGQTWKNLRVRLDEEGIAIPGNIGGNWVVALKRQILPDGASVVWAGARGEAGGVNSINFTRDNGETWTFSDVAFAWDFAFTENAVWAGHAGRADGQP